MTSHPIRSRIPQTLDGVDPYDRNVLPPILNTFGFKRSGITVTYRFRTSPSTTRTSKLPFVPLDFKLISPQKPTYFGEGGASPCVGIEGHRLTRKEVLQWRAGVHKDQLLAKQQLNATAEVPTEASLRQQLEVMKIQHNFMKAAISLKHDRIDATDDKRVALEIKIIEMKDRSCRLDAQIKDRSCRLDAEMKINVIDCKTKFMDNKFQLAIRLSQVIIGFFLVVCSIAMFYTGNDHIAIGWWSNVACSWQTVSLLY
ncbi:hypothetical protein SBOR_8980 [Sclerotinia borealis F-4128]|uniref:Uncharacterized protein n=1 Tax=Sclerotinia borealis (strain F-4128) TaxID=1432307 RepID=W9C7R8_SCLBF|nr:hypothetical protein SBOR_8980 [Sclerotinia borealis F-4128]